MRWPQGLGTWPTASLASQCSRSLVEDHHHLWICLILDSSLFILSWRVRRDHESFEQCKWILLGKGSHSNLQTLQLQPKWLSWLSLGGQLWNHRKIKIYVSVVEKVLIQSLFYRKRQKYAVCLLSSLVTPKNILDPVWRCAVARPSQLFFVSSRSPGHVGQECRQMFVYLSLFSQGTLLI